MVIKTSAISIVISAVAASLLVLLCPRRHVYFQWPPGTKQGADSVSSADAVRQNSPPVRQEPPAEPSWSQFPSQEPPAETSWSPPPAQASLRGQSASTSQAPAAPEADAGAPREGTVITTLMTKFTAEQKRLLNSIKLFEPDATVYVACSTSVVFLIQNASAGIKKLHLSVTLDKWVGFNRPEMTKRNIWTKFQMEKAAILRIAIKEEGRGGAWYMDGDMFLLAPLPQIAAEVGLSQHRASRNTESTYGIYNGGCVFFRSEAALAYWEEAAPRAPTSCCKDQTSLVAVAKKFKSSFQEVGCGVNVGWWRMSPAQNDGRSHFDLIRCTNGQVQFNKCTIQSMHYHIGDDKGKLIRPALDRAVRECNHPVLPILLESYGLPSNVSATAR